MPTVEFLKKNGIIVNGQFVYMPSAAFDTMTRMKAVVAADMARGSGCHGGNKCQIYQSCSGSFIMLAIDKLVTLPEIPNVGQLLAHIDQTYAQHLAAYVVLIEFKAANTIELYDVCTLVAHRRKGAMKAMMSHIAGGYTGMTLWLGVALDNPLWDVVVKSYIGVGFGSPYITFTTPGGGARLSFPIMGMTLVTNGSIPVPSQAIVNDNISIANRLRAKNVNPKPVCMSKQTLEKFSDKSGFIMFPRETGGAFTFTEAPTMVELGFDAKDLVIGDMLMINYIPPAIFTFHTHPVICYVENGCYIGWPSHVDMCLSLTKYGLDKQIQHFVFTMEGVYGIEPSTYAKVVFDIIGETWAENGKFFERLMSNIEAYFFNILQFREINNANNVDVKKLLENCVQKQVPKDLCLESFVKNVHIEKKFKFINDFLKTVNSLTFEAAINYVPPDGDKMDTHTNVPPHVGNMFNASPIFNMTFSSWDTIMKSQLFADKYQIGVVSESPSAYIGLAKSAKSAKSAKPVKSKPQSTIPVKTKTVKTKSKK
jgi:hypothetical protein